MIFWETSTACPKGFADANPIAVEEEAGLARQGRVFPFSTFLVMLQAAR